MNEVCVTSWQEHDFNILAHLVGRKNLDLPDFESTNDEITFRVERIVDVHGEGESVPKGDTQCLL